MSPGAQTRRANKKFTENCCDARELPTLSSYNSWSALGVFGTFSLNWIAKPVLITFTRNSFLTVLNKENLIGKPHRDRIGYSYGPYWITLLRIFLGPFPSLLAVLSFPLFPHLTGEKRREKDPRPMQLVCSSLNLSPIPCIRIDVDKMILIYAWNTLNLAPGQLSDRLRLDLGIQLVASTVWLISID